MCDAGGFKDLVHIFESCDFQQGGILKSVDSDKPVQHRFQLRNSK